MCSCQLLSFLPCSYTLRSFSGNRTVQERSVRYLGSGSVAAACAMATRAAYHRACTSPTSAVGVAPSRAHTASLSRAAPSKFQETVATAATARLCASPRHRCSGEATPTAGLGSGSRSRSEVAGLAAGPETAPGHSSGARGLGASPERGARALEAVACHSNGTEGRTAGARRAQRTTRGKTARHR